MACLVTLCEFFPGIRPRWGLWRRIFFAKRQSDGEGAYVVYFGFKFDNSIQGWRDRWFYVLDEKSMGPKFGLAKCHADALVVRMKSWKHSMPEAEFEGVERLMDRILALNESGLIGLHIIATFIHHRVQPLQGRPNFMWEYSRAKGSYRVLEEELSSNELIKSI
jgi:hypothetical protein